MSLHSLSRKALALEDYLLDAFAGGKISQVEFDALVKVNRQLRSNRKPRFNELLEWRQTFIRMTGKPPPLTALISGNNRSFLTTEMRGLYRLEIDAITKHNGAVRKAGKGELRTEPSPREWAATLVNTDSNKLSGARTAAKIALQNYLIQFLGRNYRDIITQSRRQIRAPTVLLMAIPRPAARSLPQMRTALKTILNPATLPFFLKGINGRLRAAILDQVKHLGVPRFIDRALANDGMKRVMINIGHMSNLKGGLFEHFSMSRKTDRLRRILDATPLVKRRMARRRTFLVQGLQIRIPDAAGKLGPPLQFKDGVIMTFSPGKKKSAVKLVHDFEDKSFPSGDWDALKQNEKWSRKIPEGAELIIDDTALVTRMAKDGTLERVSASRMFSKGRMKRIPNQSRFKRKRTKTNPSRHEYAFVFGGEVDGLRTATSGSRSRVRVFDASDNTVHLPSNASQLGLDTTDFFTGDIGVRERLPIASGELDYYTRVILEEAVISMASGKRDPGLPEYSKVYGFKK